MSSSVLATETPTQAPPTRRALWFTLAAAFLGWMFDGMEMGIFPLVARPALHDMLAAGGDAEVGTWMGRITALFLLGAAVGGGLFGWLGDRVGRVRAMAVSIFVYSVFTGACYFATEPWHLAALRFVASLGMGGEWALGVALVMETWPEKHRLWLAGAIGAASNIGFLIIGLIGYRIPITTDSWRWVMLVGAAPALLVFFIRLFVPESEKWKQAAALRPARPWREIFTPPLLSRTVAAIAFASVALLGTWGSVQWIPLWADRMTHGTAPEAKAMAQILIAGGAVVGSFAGALGGGLGRRAAYCLLCVASVGLCALLFRGVEHYGPAFLVLSFLTGAATAAFYGWLPLYLPELFPTRVRATAQGLGYNFGRIFAAFGAIWAGQLVAHYGGDYARMGATISLVYLIGAVGIWFAPETRGRPLPE